jgi:predicted O-methyltransferase YrrM
MVKDLSAVFGELGWSPEKAEIHLKDIPLNHEVKARDLELITLVNAVVRPRMILEIGSWLGASILSWLKETDSEVKLVALDTWLGSLEHLSNQFPKGEWKRDTLEPRLGRANFYDQFLKVIQSNKLLHRIYPLSATSRHGLMFLYQMKQKFDVIYIDASHELVDVYLDLVASIPVLQEVGDDTSGGVLCGDDYLWPEVAQAVNTFAKSKSVKVFVKNNSWVMTEFLEEQMRTKLEQSLTDTGWSTVLTSQSIGESPDSLVMLDQMATSEVIAEVIKDVKDFEKSRIGTIWKTYKLLRRIKYRLVTRDTNIANFTL